jgi:hypothetical protein
MPVVLITWMRTIQISCENAGCTCLKDLVLVKGLTHQSEGKRTYVHVLVLARTERQDGEYGIVREDSCMNGTFRKKARRC